MLSQLAKLSHVVLVLRDSTQVHDGPQGGQALSAPEPACPVLDLSEATPKRKSDREGRGEMWPCQTHCSLSRG